MMNQEEKRSAAATGLPVRWVSASTAGVVTQKAWADGLMIANASRPLVGEVAWNGKFRKGVYYAAGTFAELGEHWRRNDAVEIRLISPAEVLQAVVNEAYKRGCGDDLKAMATSELNPEMLAELASSWLDMPFSAEQTEVEFQRLLAGADWITPANDEKLYQRLSALAKAQGGEDSPARHFRNALAKGELSASEKESAWAMLREEGY